MKPGIHFDVPEAEYHADPAETPSLSCSVARILIEQTARRAQHAHPRLTSMGRTKVPTKQMGEGSLLHAMVLGTPVKAVVVEADNYRTDKAKAVRDDALERDLVPVLRARYPELEALAAQARESIASVPELAPMLDPDAKSEVTMLWEDQGGILCRARVDRLLPGTRTPMYDLKFSEKVDPLTEWDRRFVKDAFDLRTGFYRRGHQALFGVEVPYIYVVIEIVPPCDVLALQAAPQMLEMGESKASVAVELWGAALRTGRFDGYARRVHHVAPPGWAENQWNDSQAMRSQPTLSRTRIPA